MARRFGLSLLGVRLRRRLLFAGLALATLPVGSALAATTIGQTGTPPPGGAAVLGIVEGANQGYVVPAGGGVITSFQFASGNCLTNVGFVRGPFDFQLLRPLGGNQYQVLGDTGNQTDPCDGQLHSYPVDIPAQAGDVLGFYTVNLWAGLLSFGGPSVAFDLIPEPNVGDTVTLPITNAVTIDESATLVTPPTNKGQCMNGGWQDLSDNKGTPFKNQGDCVSFVATGGKNPADG